MVSIFSFFLKWVNISLRHEIRVINWFLLNLFLWSWQIRKAWAIGDLLIGDRFFAIGSGSAIAICSYDRGAIGDRKIKDRDCKNAIFLAIVAFCSKYEVNYCKIAGNLKLNFKVEADERT